MSVRVSGITESNYVPMEGRKIGGQTIAHEFGLDIFFLYYEINKFEIKFWVKKTLVVSYSQDVIA